MDWLRQVSRLQTRFLAVSLDRLRLNLGLKRLWGLGLSDKPQRRPDYRQRSKEASLEPRRQGLAHRLHSGRVS